MKIRKLFSTILLPAAAALALTACEGDATDSIKSIYGEDVNSSSVVTDREKIVKQKLLNKKWSIINTGGYNNVLSASDCVFFSQDDCGAFYSSSSDKIVSSFTYKVRLNKIILSMYNGAEITIECHLNVLFGENFKLVPADMTTSGDTHLMNNLQNYCGSIGDNIFWYFDKQHTLYVSGHGKLTEKSPRWQNLSFNRLEMQGITEIGDCVLENLNIRNLVLPSSLQKIGKFAFRNMKGSANIEIPSSLVEIDDYAFYKASLNRLTINEFESSRLRRIGACAFAETGISFDGYFPSSLRVIDRKAFYNAEVTQPDFEYGIEEIGDSAFNKIKYSYKDLTLPNSVCKIGREAFNGSITNIRVGSGLTFIPEKAFVVDSFYGNIYINQTTPPRVSGSIIYNSGNDAAADSYFTLHVPIGCASNYRSDSYWSGFGNIFDDI